MNIKSLIYIIFFLILLPCCKSRIENLSSSENFPPSKKIEKIYVPEKESNLINYINEDIDFIKLESDDENIIGNVSKLIYYNDAYYIQDDVTKTLFEFDDQGNFIRKFSKLGRGPGEYAQLKDFNINKFSNLLEIYDRQSQKIMFYDFDGNLVQTKKTVKFFDAFISYGKDDYVFQVASDNPKKNNFFIEKNERLISEYIGIRGFDKIRLVNQLTENNDFIYLTHGASNYVYYLDCNNDKIVPKYFIDFGKYNMPAKMLNKQEIGVQEFFKLIAKDYSRFVCGFYEDENLITFSYAKKRKFLWTLFDKRNAKALTGNITFFGKEIAPPVYRYNNFYFTVIESSEFLDMAKNVEGESILSERIRKIANEITTKDLNPILIKFELKEKLEIN